MFQVHKPSQMGLQRLEFVVGKIAVNCACLLQGDLDH